MKKGTTTEIASKAAHEAVIESAPSTRPSTSSAASIETSNTNNKLEENRLRAKFLHPTVKYIVSHHSGTILADKDPNVPLDDAFKEKGKHAFSSSLEPGKSNIRKSRLPEVLKKLGYEYDTKHILSVCEKIYSGPDLVDLERFLVFLSQFQAPEYYYGQRLRKYVSRGMTDQFCDLLIRGCNVNTADGEGLTSLHYAANYNKSKAIEAIIHLLGPDAVKNSKGNHRSHHKMHLVVDARDKYGWTPLHCASHHGSTECAKLFLHELGADVSVKNNVGKTALHAAMGQNRSLIAEMLVQAGASLNAKDSKGMTPLHECAYRGHISLHSLMSRHATVDAAIRDDMGNLSSDYCVEFAN